VFEEEYWGKRSLHRRTDGAQGFDDLLSLDDIDRIVSSHGLRLPAFRLVKGGSTLPPVTYTKTTRTGSEAATGVMDASAVFREFGSGATLVFQGMHRYWEPLGLFCRQLELALGHPVQANAYVTPPGSQGFDAHEDEHDVFVLQSHGTKHWMVYERHDLPPTRPPVIDSPIGPGDSLYIPVGLPHAASTQKETSVHITVGILSLTWGTVLSEAVKLTNGDLMVAEPLPLRFADQEALAKLVEERLSDLGGLIAKADAALVTDRIRRQFLTTRQPVLRGQIHQLLALDDLSDASVVRLRDGAVCVLGSTDGELCALLGDRELRMPAWVEPAMQLIIERDSLTVADLDAYLDQRGRIVLVRRLIVEGLLEVVE
jgi:bifunctional lysine-specific demethylase and histidyl-hydroxylase NO66